MTTENLLVLAIWASPSCSFSDKLRVQGRPAQTATVEGKPYVEIIRFAWENDIGLIVMSTRGCSGMSRWPLGSVADRVVRGATVPLLLVQARGEKEI